MKKGKRLVLIILLSILGAVIGSGVIGLLLSTPLFHMDRIYDGDVTVQDFFVLRDLADPRIWAVGLTVAAVGAVLWLALGRRSSGGKRLLGGSAKGVDSPLENSRFLTDKERDANFPGFNFFQAAASSKDGVPVRAVMDKKGNLQVNILGGAHALVIGATGSGKTTTFINPMIQIIGATSAGSSMIMTDPKGELFSLHSKYLQSRGYNVMVLDLRDTYSSYRWNPLDSIWEIGRASCRERV